MHMLYNSDSFVVVQFDVPVALQGQHGPERGDALTHGGYEIVDKFARKEIFIHGALAQTFKEGVQALIDGDPSEDEVDDYLSGYTSLMHQPVVSH
ncbi:MAG: DUF3567 domain-containing protein [Burkholderiaceae bacterium]